jgi:hypothetical protein
MTLFRLDIRARARVPPEGLEQRPLAGIGLGIVIPKAIRM